MSRKFLHDSFQRLVSHDRYSGLLGLLPKGFVDLLQWHFTTCGWIKNQLPNWPYYAPVKLAGNQIPRLAGSLSLPTVYVTPGAIIYKGPHWKLVKIAWPSLHNC